MNSLTLLQVYPLTKKSFQGCYHAAGLSPPVVKAYLSGVQIRILWDNEWQFADENNDGNVENNENRNRSGENADYMTKLKVDRGFVYIPGETTTHFDQRSTCIDMSGSSNFDTGLSHHLDLPLISLPSQDPTELDGIPCVLRGYYSWTSSTKVNCGKFMEKDFLVSSQTLIQIMPPIMALVLDQEKQICTLDVQLYHGGSGSEKHFRFPHLVSFQKSLFGTSSLSCGQNEKQHDLEVLSCFEVETQRALVLRMQRLLSNPYFVGTTKEALKEQAMNAENSARLKNALHIQNKATGVEQINTTISDSLENRRQKYGFSDDVALTVYGDSHGSFKTALVSALARTVIKCQAVHVINGSTIFAEFGASSSDIALESILHQIVISAAIQALVDGDIGSICIVLDQLDSFIPCPRSQSGGSVDPSTPALNANGAFLNKLMHSLQLDRLFPFPTRNPYYTAKGQRGFLFPVKLCIVGIVTCDERRLKDKDYNNRTILDVLGRNVFCISTNKSRRPVTNQKDKIPEEQMFDSVGGNNNAKEMLQDVLALDKRKKTLLRKFGLCLPTGVLLYGPPGTGKTLLAKATAKLLRKENNRFGSGAFIPLNASDIICSAIGESEKLLTSTFESARKRAPSVIFIDEFQALFTSRDKGNGSGTKGSGRLASTLLTLMDDLTQWRDANTAVAPDSSIEIDDKRVVVLAATNTPWLVDGAFLRSGRFDRVVHVRIPTLLERHAILKVHVNKMKLSDECDLDEICNFMASECEGYSGADLSNLARAAVCRCISSSCSEVKLDHFIEAKRFDVTQPSSDVNLISRLNNWKP